MTGQMDISAVREVISNLSRAIRPLGIRVDIAFGVVEERCLAALEEGFGGQRALHVFEADKVVAHPHTIETWRASVDGVELRAQLPHRPASEPEISALAADFVSPRSCTLPGRAGAGDAL